MHAIKGTVGSSEFNPDTLDFEVVLTLRFPNVVKADLAEQGNTEAFIASFATDTLDIVADQLKYALIDEAQPEIAVRTTVK